MKKNNLKVMVWFFSILLISISVFAFGFNFCKEYRYNKAVELIENGEYQNALTVLEKLNPDTFDKRMFIWLSKNITPENCYKQSAHLYAYALAQQEYNYDNADFDLIYEYLEYIPKDYTGKIRLSIKTFRQNFMSQYEVYEEEKKRLEEEAKLEEQRKEQEYLASLKDRLPYKGMSKLYINDTMLGHNHESDVVVVGKGTRREFTKYEYRWKNNSGETIFYAECRDGIVTEVSKYYEDKYWTKDGRSIFKGKREGYMASRSRKKKVYNGDDYDVGDYYDAEDFYYDHYDDFYEYEEAEEYFNEYGEW